MAAKEEPLVISLAAAPGTREAWSKPVVVLLLWIVAEYVFVTNPLQLSSRIRAHTLRLFGAKIGKDVILRPRLRVKFPWNLEIGENSWIGEGVWIHNQDKVTIGHDVCVSQETFITTGSHDFRRDMALITRPVVIESGAWICSRVTITQGVTVGTSTVVGAGCIVGSSLEAGIIVTGQKLVTRGARFKS